MVFNPTGWKRSEWVDTLLVSSGGGGAVGDNAVATSPDGKTWPVREIDPISHLCKLYAGDVPAFGYRVFHIMQGPKSSESTQVSGDTIENKYLRVRFDTARGTVSSIYDKIARREVVASAGSIGRLEAHYEKPAGMSAWTLGPIEKVEPVALASDPTEFDQDGTKPGVTEDHGDGIASFDYMIAPQNGISRATPVRQTFRLRPDSRELEVDVDCDWRIIGDGVTATPTLRVAFDANLAKPKATFEVPFGAIERPTDGSEWPGLNWGDLGADNYGLSILNDSKSGMSATGNTYRLTLIRSSFSPDPNPNPGRHHWRYAIFPHQGDWAAASVARKGMELNQPLMCVTVPYDARGASPLEWSAAAFSDQSVVPTCLKRSEDGNALVLRAYLDAAAPSSGAIHVNAPFTSPHWVNFVEDDLGAAPYGGSTIPLNLHGFEIRTVKVDLLKNMSSGTKVSAGARLQR
jgi:alpha-mannosidase